MSVSVRYYRSIAAIVALLVAAPALAIDEHPFSHARIEGLMDPKRGVWTDCSEPAGSNPARREQITRRWSRLTHDPCEWTAPVNQKDRSVPAPLYRSGQEVTCALEEWKLDDGTTLDRNSYAVRLSSRGIKAVTVDRDDEERIGDEPWRHQVLAGTLASVQSKPRQRIHAWLWAGNGRAVALGCSGPVDAVDADLPTLQKLAESLKIDHTAVAK